MSKYAENRELPLVSVITPAYNSASFLDETIQSVLNQDYPRIEYIVLDDGSTDDTLNVIKKYEEKIRWESHKNVGETRTVNKGFSMARGEIIGVVNSDDPLLPDAIRTVVECMMADPRLLVVYPDWYMIDKDGKIIRHIKTFEYNYINMIRWHHCIPGPGSFFRREVVEKLQGRDIQFRYVADYDFWLRAGLLGPFARIPVTLATFRVHPDSASVSQKGELMAKEHILLIDKIYSLPNLPAEVLKVKREAYSSANYIAGVVFGDKAHGIKREYYKRALRYCPWGYIFEYRRRLLTILPVLLDGLYPLMKPSFKPYKLARRLLKCQR